ncbi:MAG TPA: DNA-formamidopyrimidine glycosylase family protein [Microbacteriaceae bacterium]|nr:DNA-formamidopyrimidine glycosylase family protein [Microbacteriaceae bacterium]
MPEGHSVHRIARQFARNLVGAVVHASSPQGRFEAGAAEIDGRTLRSATAVGKQMFLDFGDGVFVRVHLGMYGAWDFAGDIALDATIASANGRMGHTAGRGTDDRVLDRDGENSLASIGAPRRSRLRMAESEQTSGADSEWPPEPVGQVRLRLLTESLCADLRGPTACEVLDPAGVDAVLRRLGPDPLGDDAGTGEERFLAAVLKRRVAIGLLLMDQSVVSGIGNVYRAELLFRAGLNPHQPGATLAEEAVRALWRDWDHLLRIGVERGQMLTIDGLEGEELRAALANRADRHWVYKREGLPCRRCGTNIVLEEMATRKLYWCPSCQALPGAQRRARTARKEPRS